MSWLWTQVLKRLNKTGLCVSHPQMTRIIRQLGENHDNPVLHWKAAAENSNKVQEVQGVDPDAGEMIRDPEIKDKDIPGEDRGAVEDDQVADQVAEKSHGAERTHLLVEGEYQSDDGNISASMREGGQEIYSPCDSPGSSSICESPESRTESQVDSIDSPDTLTSAESPRNSASTENSRSKW